MIGTIITHDKDTISFGTPKDYVGKQIEVIAPAQDEELTQEPTIKKKVSFNALAIVPKVINLTGTKHQ